jgi:hypothetical protein
MVESIGESAITWTSPFSWRPHDTVAVQLRPGQYAGCVLELRQSSDQRFHPLEAKTIRHRWGEHLDRDLRDFIDDGSTRPYRFSGYRADVADWAILDTLEDRSWLVARPLWARAEVQFAPARSWMAVRREPAGEHLLDAGTVLWTFAVCRQSSVRCLAQLPDGLNGLVVPDRLRSNERYRGIEFIVPVAAFGRELIPRDGSG